MLIEDKYYYSLERIFKYTVIIASIIAVLNLLKLFLLTYMPLSLLEKLNISEGMTMASDRNFFALLIILALLMVNYYKVSNTIKKLFPKVFNIFLNILFITTVLLSGSRRGVLALFILFFIYAIIIIRQNSEKYKKRDFYIKITKWFISFITIILIGIFLIKTLPKQKITDIVYRYSTILDMDDYAIIDLILWGKKMDYLPTGNEIIDSNMFLNQPDFWLFPTLQNDTLQLVNTPYGKGFRIYNKQKENKDFFLAYQGPEILFYANHTYKIKFKIKVKKGDLDSFIIKILPSNWKNEEGRGITNIQKRVYNLGNNWYEVEALYTFNYNQINPKGFLYTKGIIDFEISDFSLIDLDYNPDLPKFAFERKYKINIKEWINNVNQPISNDTSLINNGDFSLGLKYWTTAANNVDISLESLGKNNCVRIKRSNGKRGYFSLKYVGSVIDFKANNVYQISLKVKPLKPTNKMPFKLGFGVNEGSGFVNKLPQNIDTLPDGWYKIQVRYKFINDHKNINFPISGQLLNSEFLVTDLKLENLSQKQLMEDSKNKETKKNKFSSPRTDRWLFAKELWITKFKWHHKLFGHGFDYLEWYAAKFHPRIEKSDYPHNPFLSVLLYSGILGLVLYVYLMIKVFGIYIRNIKRYPILFIFFLITFFFSFFSANNPIDPPIMGFFVLLPFFVDYIYKKDKSS